MAVRTIHSSPTPDSGRSGAIEKKQDEAKSSPNLNALPQPATGTQGFGVSISPTAQDYIKAKDKALEIARATSPVREDRVAELKRKIADGTYVVNAEAIAEGMFKEAKKDDAARELQKLSRSGL